MSVLRSLLLFALAAVAEIGGAWLVWQGAREHRGFAFIGAGIAALGAYGFVATFQEDANFGRVLSAYGGIFVVGSLAWGMALDGFRPDRFDIAGDEVVICLSGRMTVMREVDGEPEPVGLGPCEAMINPSGVWHTATSTNRSGS